MQALSLCWGYQPLLKNTTPSVLPSPPPPPSLFSQSPYILGGFFASVYVEKEATLEYIIYLIGSSLQKREASDSVTRQDYKLWWLFIYVMLRAVHILINKFHNFLLWILYNNFNFPLIKSAKICRSMENTHVCLFPRYHPLYDFLHHFSQHCSLQSKKYRTI